MVDLPEEIMQSGSVTVYADSDRQIVSDVNAYNDFMSECRIKMETLEEVKLAFNVVNPLVACVFAFSTAKTFFANPLLAIAVLAVNAVLLVALAWLKDKFLLPTIATALFLLIDLKLVILLVFDIVILIIYERMSKPLKAHPRYPLFNDINIIRINSLRPKIYNTDTNK